MAGEGGGGGRERGRKRAGEGAGVLCQVERRGVDGEGGSTLSRSISTLVMFLGGRGGEGTEGGRGWR